MHDAPSPRNKTDGPWQFPCIDVPPHQSRDIPQARGRHADILRHGVHERLSPSYDYHACDRIRGRVAPPDQDWQEVSGSIPCGDWWTVRPVSSGAYFGEMSSGFRVRSFPGRRVSSTASLLSASSGPHIIPQRSLHLRGRVSPGILRAIEYAAAQLGAVGVAPDAGLVQLRGIPDTRLQWGGQEQGKIRPDP